MTTETKPKGAPVELNLENVTAAIRKVVEGREDYVYEQEETPIGSGTCKYTRPDSSDGVKPGCIVGQVLAELVPDAMPYLHSIDYEGAEDYPDTDSYSILNLLEGHGFIFPVDDDWIYGLKLAQEYQDEERPWGHALAEFERVTNQKRA